MSTELITISHYAVTGLIAAITLYRQFKKDGDKKSAVCKQDFQDLKVKVAVLEERIENEVHLLERLDNKLDKLVEK